MASTSGAQLAALCSLTSFLWLAHNLEGHQLIEQPRLSSVLCLLIAGASSLVASFFALWLPGANGRFDDELALLKARATLPRKPRRFFLPGLVVCIVLRLEVFHRVSFDIQCSKPGIEAWLPLVILAYELLPGKPRSNSGIGEKYEDDMGQTIFDALGDWLSGSRLPLVAGILTLSCGTYLASSPDTRSTYFCSGSTYLVVFLQWTGLFLDAGIIIMLWRLLAWARTTKTRLKTLGGILLVSALGTGLLYSISRIFQPSMPVSYHFRGLDSLYVFDVAIDGLAFSVFLIATALLATEGSPLSLVGITTCIFGLLSAVYRIALVGSWENVSPSSTYLALTLVCNGFAFFIYANNLRSVVFIHRAFIVFFLIILTIAATIYTLIVGSQVLDGHPLERLIYDSRVEADRWLIHASVSDSLHVAVQEYKERNHGRDPPPNFDVWYKFAKDRKSIILDHFAQIEADIFPFYGMAPEKIREDVRRLDAEPEITVVRIRNGTLVHDAQSHKDIMDNLATMVSTFGRHLPEGLEFAVNMNDRPRVLAPWEDVKRFTAAADHKGLSRLLSRRSLGDNLEKGPRPELTRNHATVRALREMTALACPPGTKTRSGVHWDVRDFCSSCAEPQSKGPYLTNWPIALELCHQSDLLRLHGFHMVSSEVRPLQELVPVFSRSKTDAYSDILIPLGREDKSDGDGAFATKHDKLFWRGERDVAFDRELFQGGHQGRLVHLVNASMADKTTILLPVSKNPGRFAYEQVSTAELNAMLPLDVQIMNEDEAAVDSKYILVMDTNDGPPKDFLRVLRSTSVPFLASIFREWYTERLLPWVHFVPIDLRFHALHGTLAYFVGLNRDGKGRISGRDVTMEPSLDNAKWIADEGRRFASRAVRREDMEVYLFRLLLEWARVVDDKRDELGLRL